MSGALALVLAAGVGEALRRLLGGRGPAAAVFLFAFAASCFAWIIDPRLLPTPAFPPALGAGAILWRGALVLVLGGFSFFWARRGAVSLAQGIFAGALFSLMGSCAYRWIGFAEAFRRLGDVFAALSLSLLLPLFFAASMVGASFALLGRDFRPWRGRLLAALVSFWLAATAAAQWRLRSAWDYGPADLSAAAGLFSARSPRPLSVARLASARGRIYVVEPLGEEASGTALSPANLERLAAYLKARRYRSVFGRQALDLLRRGSLLRWDGDYALSAHMLAPPMAVPEYRQALALIRSGPLTPRRLEKLKRLMSSALTHRGGFEAVTQSQYIFEGFAAAFARFGEAESTRFWLEKVDGLWPIYEKKVEVPALEIPIDGEIAGSVSRDGKPATDVKVGLFYHSLSTQTYRDGANLCCSQYPDARGRFRFSSLGAGQYRMALQADSSLLQGRVVHGPGVIELSENEHFQSHKISIMVR